MKYLVYHTVRFLTSIVLKLFYRGIEVNGEEHIPEKGTPFIYAPNHQNALTDALIVGVLSPIPVYYLTRSDVFKSPFKWFLEALNMMPIYRIRDGYASLSKNDMVFERCRQLLSEGKPIMIFPEGNHGLDYHLRPLTKGISRIALDSQDTMEDKVYVVPMGINYFDHLHSGRKLIVNYGPPLSVDEYLNAYKKHKNTGYNDIKFGISERMKQLLVIPEKNEGYEEAIKVFNRKNESKNFAQLRSMVAQGVKSKSDKTYPWLKPIGMLLAIPNLLIFALSQYIISNKIKEIIFTSTIKIVVSVLLFPIWLMLCFGITSYCWGFTVGIGILLVQIICIILRREILRFAR